MTETLRESIENLRSLSPKLNKATDDANNVVQAVETFLNDECRLGVPAEVLAIENDDEHSDTSLAYARVAGKYRIAVTTRWFKVRDEDGTPFTDDFGNPEPILMSVETSAWSESPRAMKLKTFKELPTLLEQLAKEAEEAISSTTEASEAVGKILAALNHERPSVAPTDKPAAKIMENTQSGKFALAAPVKLVSPDEGKILAGEGVIVGDNIAVVLESAVGRGADPFAGRISPGGTARPGPKK